VAQQNDNICDPATTIDAVADPGQATVCDDGSDVPVLAIPTASLPDVEFIVEIDDVIVDINADASIDPALLVEGAELCATAFTYDLAEINSILTTANSLCPILDCDELTGLPGTNVLIAELVNGDNDGVPGLNDLQEALDFAAVFGAISSVEDADTALTAVNDQVGDILGFICYGTSAPICYTVESCALIPGNDNVCDPTTTIDPVVAPGQTEICSDGSDQPALTAPAASLPDVEFIVEVNGVITDINADGTLDPALIAGGDVVCATAFTYDLAEINSILTTANSLCPILDCDELTGLPGTNVLIGELVNGDNDGVPGLNDLQEALDFAGVFGAIASVADADTALTAVNDQVGSILGFICYGTSEAICFDVVDCACLDCDDPTCNVITRPCDDGDDCTLNDMETVLGDDESIVCIPCAGEAGIEGCTDLGACNYNPDADCLGNAVCDYGETECTDACNAIFGCIDATANNFDADANCDDGSCTFDSGCIDPTACNFDSTAVVDDGSCTNEDPGTGNTDICAGDTEIWNAVTCTYDVDETQVLGCTDATANNYNADANCDDESCMFDVGCIDPTACNFDAMATVDDGSCEFTSCLGCVDPTACNFDTTATIDDGTCILPDGCTDQAACNYDPEATCDDGSCDLGNGDCPDPCNVVLGCTSATACNFDAAANCDDDSCDEPNGCTDLMADNYDPAATCDDGSCTFIIAPCPDDISIGLIERDGAFYVIPDWNTSGMETYTWYDAADNVVGHFTGNAYFSPLATGEYTCIVYDPANDCTQEFGPRLASETNGCCELESDNYDGGN